MVKFGRHVEAYATLAESQGSSLYVVPYSEIRNRLIENSNEPPVAADVSTEDGHNGNKKGSALELFQKEWISCLDKAVADFDQAMTSLWRIVFDKISFLEESRGAVPDKAFRMFLATASVEESRDLLTRINDISETSFINAEALRKLCKKYDKQHNQHLSFTLLPKLYAANLTVAQSTLEDGLNMLRETLQLDNDEDMPDPTNSSLKGDRRGQLHDAVVDRRREELNWLKELVQSIAPSELEHIVAHRGFHNPRDFSDRRPLENPLAAYEAAWTSGIKLCECDIAMTKDEKLVLAHDEDFSRLALDKDSPWYNINVRDLTFRELISMPLKSGNRPPLLIDVLRSARAIEGDSQLIIEIKPGNSDAAQALSRLFIRHPDLMEQCAVIMSFDLFAMHTLRQDLAILNVDSSTGIRTRHRSKLSLGSLGLPLDASGEGFVPLGPRRDSNDHFGVGLSISERPHSFHTTQPATSPSNSPRPPSGFLNRVSPSAGNLHRLDKQERKIPKLMLLTVAEKPKIPCELEVGVNDLEQVNHWLHREDGSLDGVYLQFQKQMMHTEGTEALKQLASRYTVGVWSHAHVDPDNYETFHHLVRGGNVDYINSDLPRGFKNKSLRRGTTFEA